MKPLGIVGGRMALAGRSAQTEVCATKTKNAKRDAGATGCGTFEAQGKPQYYLRKSVREG